MNYSSSRWLLLAFSALGIYYVTSASRVPELLVADCAAGSMWDGPLDLRAPKPFSLRLVNPDTTTDSELLRLEEVPDSTESQHSNADRLSLSTPILLRFSDIGELQEAATAPPVVAVTEVPAADGGPPAAVSSTLPEGELIPTRPSRPRVEVDSARVDMTEPTTSETPPNFALASIVSGQRKSTPNRLETPSGRTTHSTPDTLDVRRGPMEIVMPKAKSKPAIAKSKPAIAKSELPEPAVPEPALPEPALPNFTLQKSTSTSTLPKFTTPNFTTPKFQTPAPRVPAQSQGIMHSFDSAAETLEIVAPAEPTAMEPASQIMDVPDTDPVLKLEPTGRLHATSESRPMPQNEPTASLERAPDAAVQMDSSNPQEQSKEVIPDVGWRPLDMKTIELDATTNVRRPRVTEATPQDKLLAQEALRLAFESAQKRMYFAARARFIETIRIVARSLDDQSGTPEHSQAVRRALAAYEEAAEFFPNATRLDEDINLAAIVGGHDTTLLQTAAARNLTPRQCLREYMALAEQEFVRGLEQDPLGAQALYGLGRLQSVADSGIQQSAHVRAHRSTMLFQTALRIDPHNFAAANELGVLLARYGKYPEAIQALQHSVRVSPQPAAWNNLARVHEKLGQLEEARLASQRAAELAKTAAPSPITIASRPEIEWVDARTFAGTRNDQMADDQVDMNAKPRAAAVEPQRTAAMSQPKKMKPWFWRN